MELHRRRVRAHVPPASPPSRRDPWSLRPDEPALLVHVLADDVDQVAAATTRELVITATGPVTISERIFTPTDKLDAIPAQAGTVQSDAAGALGGEALSVDRIEALGQLICRRSYLQRWPLVASGRWAGLPRTPVRRTAAWT